MRIRKETAAASIAAGLVLSLAAASPACSNAKSSTPPPPPPADTGPPTLAKVTSVLTQHNDNGRTGTNALENCLTPSVVSSLIMKTELPIDGQIYAQPLVLAGNPNLLIVASTANEVKAFDISTLSTTPVWQVGPETLGTPGDVIRGVAGSLGILSTPVIDPATARLYVVARSCATATTLTSCPWTLHVIDTSSGHELDSVVIATSFKDSSGVSHAFNPDVQWNRPSLLFQSGSVFVGWEVGQSANQSESMQPFHGMLMSFDAANLHSPPVTLVMLRDATGGGVWQGGAGPAGDGTSVYINSANRTSEDPPASPSDLPTTPSDHENSTLKLDYDGGGLQVTSYFDNRPYHSDGNVFQYLNFYDGDISSSGLTLIPNSNDMVLGSKAGIVYLIDRTTMQPTQAPISPFIETPLPAGQTLHLIDHATGVFGAPVVWRRTSDAMVFIWPHSDPLTSFQYDASARTLAVLARSMDTTPQGAMLSLTVNGTQQESAILWANLSTGDGNVGTTAEIRAYDPEKLTSLWSAPLPGYAKWVCPTISGGRVYVPASTLSAGSEVLVFTTPHCEN